MGNKAPEEQRRTGLGEDTMIGALLHGNISHVRGGVVPHASERESDDVRQTGGDQAPVTTEVSRVGRGPAHEDYLRLGRKIVAALQKGEEKRHDPIPRWTRYRGNGGRRRYVLARHGENGRPSDEDRLG